MCRTRSVVRGGHPSDNDGGVHLSAASGLLAAAGGLCAAGMSCRVGGL